MGSKPSKQSSIYGQVALSQAYRILGLGDRDENSPCYGCFDRSYWHYRQTDIVNARFQETCHFLALLYVYPASDNRFYQKDIIREWADATVDFWTYIQRSDGSFDEYWPFERSFVATAFSLAAAAETCLILSLDPPKDSILKACRWLDDNENLAVLNQMAGAAVALASSGVLLDDDNLSKQARRKIDRLLDRQAPEGYFEEYGGWDIGYLTINISYLAKYVQITNDEQVIAALKKAFRFLDGKIKANGSYDYKETSRKTQFFYPFGFRVMEENDILSRHRNGVTNNEVLNPSWMDDRFCVPLSIDYLQTAYVDLIEIA